MFLEFLLVLNETHNFESTLDPHDSNSECMALDTKNATIKHLIL